MRHDEEVKAHQEIARKAIRDGLQAYEVANASTVPGMVPGRELQVLWQEHERLRDEVHALRALLWGAE